MATPVCTIDATGIHVPTFAQCLAFYQDSYRSVYGQDIVLENSTQDGQWVAIQATALNDANAMVAAVYNAFSPSTAQGTGLSSVVKINGISRGVPSNSSADLLIIGQAGAVITNCIAADSNGNQWVLPATVTIPLSGQITVTAICSTIGAITAPAGTINQMATPTLGWQSVNNLSDAAPGEPVETDATLRLRQSMSTELPSLTILEGIMGALAAIPGVGRLVVYENDAQAPDVNGIPGHAIAIVIEGGDDATIAQTIALKKTPGAGTYGTSVQTVTNSYGIAREIRFFRPVSVAITCNITVKALPGFTTVISASINQSISNFVNALGIGTDLLLPRLYVPALLGGSPNSMTYEVMSIAIARDGGMPTPTDIAIAFDEAALCDPTFVQVTVIT